VGDVAVHDAPEPLDRIEMRAIGRNEMQLDPAAGPRQPFRHQFGVMIARIVEKDMEERHQRIDFLPPENAAALRAGAAKEGHGWRVKPIPAAVFRVARARAGGQSRQMEAAVALTEKFRCDAIGPARRLWRATR
jgi:hypothetical protein